nr:hypothetical protein Iba_chr02dCG15870 [Ipomoea batatas]
MKATVDGGKMHVFLLRAGPRFIAVILLEDTDESSSILHPPIRFWRRQNQGIVSSRKRRNREPLITKQTTRKPESKEDEPKNTNPANPRAIEMYDCTQKALSAAQVPASLIVRANAAPAASIDSNRYAKT